MRSLTKEEELLMVEELVIALNGKIDGGGKNIICTCPYCGKSGKFGVYIGPEFGRKKKFMTNCFSCGSGTRDLSKFLTDIGRIDLIPNEVTQIDEGVKVNKLLIESSDELEIDDELFIVDLPEGFEELDEIDYLEERGFEEIDYEYFPVGKTNFFKFKNYVIFPIYDDGDVVGYVARHEWSKKDIELFNKKAKRKQKRTGEKQYKIMRYMNSTDNDFIKLVYNIDNVIEDVTKTVIIVEGVFNVIALTRMLNLYEVEDVCVVATFGKKISDTQIWKLQQKGVKNVILGYDPDAVKFIKKIATKLDKYFNCLIADIQDPDKDWDELDFWEVFDVFTKYLKTPLEYNLNKVTEKKLKIV